MHPPRKSRQIKRIALGCRHDRPATQTSHPSQQYPARQPHARAGFPDAGRGWRSSLLIILAVIGQVGWIAALAGGAAIVIFAALVFHGTAPPSTAEDPDAAMLEARRKAEQEKQFRVRLVEALPEPAMYIDAQGKVEAANAQARKAFRFVVAEPQLTAVVRRPELLDAVAAARQAEPTAAFRDRRAGRDGPLSGVRGGAAGRGRAGEHARLHRHQAGRIRARGFPRQRQP